MVKIQEVKHMKINNKIINRNKVQQYVVNNQPANEYKID